MEDKYTTEIVGTEVNDCEQWVPYSTSKFSSVTVVELMVGPQTCFVHFLRITALTSAWTVGVCMCKWLMFHQCGILADIWITNFMTMQSNMYVMITNLTSDMTD